MDRKDIIALLVNKGITISDDISDADLTSALNKALGDKPAEPQTNGLTIEDVTAAVNLAVKPLNDKIDAQANAEQGKLAEQVVELDLGIDADAAGSMSVNALKSVLARNGHAAFNASNRHTKQSNTKLDSVMPE